MENMKDELQQIEIGEGIDLVEKWQNRLRFPAITFCSTTIYFNKLFTELLAGFEYVKYYTTTEFLIIEPCKNRDGAFSINNLKQGSTTVIPTHLASKKIRPGSYKVYRCKMGYAIKRYEPIEAGD